MKITQHAKILSANNFCPENGVCFYFCCKISKAIRINYMMKANTVNGIKLLLVKKKLTTFCCEWHEKSEKGLFSCRPAQFGSMPPLWAESYRIVIEQRKPCSDCFCATWSIVTDLWRFFMVYRLLLRTGKTVIRLCQHAGWSLWNMCAGMVSCSVGLDGSRLFNVYIQSMKLAHGLGLTFNLMNNKLSRIQVLLVWW